MSKPELSQLFLETLQRVDRSILKYLSMCSSVALYSRGEGETGATGGMDLTHSDAMSSGTLGHTEIEGAGYFCERQDKSRCIVVLN
ncbi:hypothetical protein KIPB_008370, partial [Kipferlia bialata]|eukprot:g8370.t1